MAKTLVLRKLHDDARSPEYSSNGKLCFELFCWRLPNPCQSLQIPPGISVVVSTGICIDSLPNSDWYINHHNTGCKPAVVGEVMVEVTNTGMVMSELRHHWHVGWLVYMPQTNPSSLVLMTDTKGTPCEIVESTYRNY